MTASRDLLAFLYAQPGHQLTDPSGRLNTQLRELTGYTGSAGGMSQLLAALEGKGLLTREIAGRRTLKVALTRKGVKTAEESIPKTRQRVRVAAKDSVTVLDALAMPRRTSKTSDAGDSGDGFTEINLEDLADALLRRVLSVADALDTSGDVAKLRDQLADAQDKLAAEKQRTDQLSKDIAALRAELDAARQQASELRLEVQAAHDRNPRSSAASRRRQEQIQKLLKAARS